MAKPHREAHLRAGEQRLQAWDVPADATASTLRNFIGRDPAADLAIAARLGALAEPASVDALQALESATSDKLVRKEVRRSLYRLEQRGLAIPPPPVSAPPAGVSAPALEGFLSPVDGRGDQLVWLIKPQAGGVAHLFAVINDPDGLQEVNLFETTRKALRASRQELLDKHELRMIEADWRYCDYLMDRAFRWATEKGGSIHGDYRGLRAKLLKTPAVEMPPPILASLDVEAVRSDARLVAESDTLIEEKEFRTWFFDQETLKPYLDEMQQVRDSPVLLNPAQQEERVRAVIERAIEELFGGAHRMSWVRRFQEMAYVFHATGRTEPAKRALAVALALEASSRGGREIAVCEALARASLALYMQREQEREAEAARTSLVVTPQQALREAQRRRQT